MTPEQQANFEDAWKKHGQGQTGSYSLTTKEHAQAMWVAALAANQPTAPKVPNKVGWYWRKGETGWYPVKVRMSLMGILTFKAGVAIIDDGLWGGPCLPPNEDGRKV